MMMMMILFWMILARILELIIIGELCVCKPQTNACIPNVCSVHFWSAKEARTRVGVASSSHLAHNVEMVVVTRCKPPSMIIGWLGVIQAISRMTMLRRWWRWWRWNGSIWC